MITVAPAWFVTGTDTEIGKTLAACAMLHRLRETYPRVVGAKPVAAGLAPGGTNEDVALLRAASTVRIMPSLDNPYALPEPVSPHLAARAVGTQIDLQTIERAVQALRQQADAVVVEGVGGFLAPLSDTEDVGDLAQRLQLPVILVVGLRLGCLNHALLTQQAIAARGLPLAGWIGSCIDPGMLRLQDNIETLRSRIPARCLGIIPHMPCPDPAVAARYLALPT